MFIRIDLPSNKSQLFDTYRIADAKAVDRCGVTGKIFFPIPARIITSKLNGYL